MLEQSDIKKIEEIIDVRINPVYGRIDSFEKSVNKKIDSLEEEMGSMKEEMGSMKEEMGSMKEEIKRLDFKIDQKFADSMEFTKQLVMSTYGEINQKLDKIIKMNTEDIVTINESVIDLTGRVSKLELSVKELQAKSA